MDDFRLSSGLLLAAPNNAEVRESGPTSFLMRPFGDRTMDQPLVEVFRSLRSRLESILQSSTLENFRTQLDDLLLLLRVWATDIRADQSSDPNSLDLLEANYQEEAVALRIHFHTISEALETLEQQASMATGNIETESQR